MKKITVLLLLTVVILLTGCSKKDKSDLKFYVIERNFLTQDLSDNQIVSTTKNNGRLAFDGNDIEGYNWETHTVTLKNNSVTSHGAVTDETGGSAIFKVNDTYAFVIIIRNKLVYYGGFIQGSKNPSTPLQPFIEDKRLTSFKIDYNSKYAVNGDHRASNQLYSFLNKNGLLSSKIN